jgi:hypothetical protein
MEGMSNYAVWLRWIKLTRTSEAASVNIEAVSALLRVCERYLTLPAFQEIRKLQQRGGTMEEVRTSQRLEH